MSAAVQGLTEIRLYGVLGKRFGRVHRLAVASVREAAQALSVVVPGFGQHLVDHSAPGYHIFIGRPGGENRGPELLDAPVSSRETICIVPVIAGSKRAGLFQTVLGVILIAVSAWVPGAQGLAPVGWAMLLGGVIALVSPQRKNDTDEKPEGLASYDYDGPVNRTTQGGPVPLRYGRVIADSVIVSQGLATERLVTATAGAPFPLQPLPPEMPVDPIWGNGGGDL